MSAMPDHFVDKRFARDALLTEFLDLVRLVPESALASQNFLIWRTWRFCLLKGAECNVEVLPQGLGQGTSISTPELTAGRRMHTPMAHDSQIDESDDDYKSHDDHYYAVQHNRDCFPHTSSPAARSANLGCVSTRRSEPDH